MCFDILGAINVTRDEVLQKLDSLGLSISRETLRRWINEGLVPEPKRGNNGRAGGRWTEYAVETVWEAFASGSLLKDNSIKQVAEIREEAQQIITIVCHEEMDDLIEAFEEFEVENLYDKEGNPDYYRYKKVPDEGEIPEKDILIDHLVFEWIMIRLKAEHDIPTQTPITVHIDYYGEMSQDDVTAKSFEETNTKTFDHEVIWGSGSTIVWEISNIKQNSNGNEIVIKDTDTGVTIKLRDRRSRR